MKVKKRLDETEGNVLEGLLFALSAKDGKQLWRSSLAANGQTKCIQSSTDGKTIALLTDADGGRTADDHVRDRASELVDVRELDVRLLGWQQALIEHPHARVVGSELDGAVARQTERFGVRKRHGDQPSSGSTY